MKIPNNVEIKSATYTVPDGLMARICPISDNTNDNVNASNIPTINVDSQPIFFSGHTIANTYTTSNFSGNVIDFKHNGKILMNFNTATNLGQIDGTNYLDSIDAAKSSMVVYGNSITKTDGTAVLTWLPLFNPDYIWVKAGQQITVSGGMKYYIELFNL